MKEMFLWPRRLFLKRVGGLTTVLVAPVGWLAESRISLAEAGEKKEEAEVSPAEDLMREHGVLSRILLIYEEIIKRLIENQALPPEVLPSSAALIRRFIEDYHEKLEEEFLFPRFEKEGKLVDLVKVLREQHQAGRRLTDWIREGAASRTLNDKNNGKGLGKNILLFIKMYRPIRRGRTPCFFRPSIPCSPRRRLINWAINSRTGNGPSLERTALPALSLKWLNWRES